MLVLAAGIMWGSAGLFSTLLSSAGLSSSMVAFFRLASGAMFLGVFLLFRYGLSVFRISLRGLAWCLLLGIFVEGLYNLSYSAAVEESGMAAATVMLYTSPVFVCIMSRFLFKEKITQIKIAALVLNIAGCMLAVTGGSFGDIHIPLTGFAAGIAAGLLYSLLPVINTETLGKYNLLTMNFYGMIIGAVMLMFISRPWEAAAQLADAKTLLTILGYGLIPTCIPYILYLKGLSKHLETSKVPVVSSFETVSSAFIGALALGQALSAGKTAGIIVVLMSVMLMNANPEKLTNMLRFRSIRGMRRHA